MMRRRSDRGTATVEIAGMLSVVMMVVGVSLYAATAIWVTNCTNAAARDGARAASLGRSVDAAVRGSLPDRLENGSLQITPESAGRNVKVTVEVVYDAPLKPIKVKRDVTMRRQ